jgi:hypothetical protein
MPRGLHLLGLLAVLPLPEAAAAQGSEIVVEAPTLQQEIERILAADNIDPAGMTAREVADALERIPRGHAPDDFWDSYRRHVRAWRRYADAESSPRLTEAEFLLVERAINETYQEAERIALRYGARPPAAQYRWRPPKQ